MRVARGSAQLIGAASILGVVGLQGFNGVACYHQSLSDLIGAFAVFVAPAVLVAVIAVFTRNPLRAVFASALFAPWLFISYYTDCIAPYRGGGASMSYVGVLMFGFPCAVLGALIAGPILGALGISVIPDSSESSP